MSAALSTFHTSEPSAEKGADKRLLGKWRLRNVCLKGPKRTASYLLYLSACWYTFSACYFIVSLARICPIPVQISTPIRRHESKEQSWKKFFFSLSYSSIAEKSHLREFQATCVLLPFARPAPVGIDIIKKKLKSFPFKITFNLILVDAIRGRGRYSRLYHHFS